jgi:hypothetical protein
MFRSDRLRDAMTIPAFVLLGFAAWTWLTLVGSIGVYRWSFILTRRTSVAEWYDSMLHLLWTEVVGPVSAHSGR